MPKGYQAIGYLNVVALSMMHMDRHSNTLRLAGELSSYPGVDYKSLNSIPHDGQIDPDINDTHDKACNPSSFNIVFLFLTGCSARGTQSSYETISCIVSSCNR